MGADQFDFAGWATYNDIRCTDNRTIRKDAFKDCDGKSVPIVWGHIHDDPEMVLGHGVLENRNEGVRIYGKFNKGPKAQSAKEALLNGDVVGLSIWANQLKQQGGDVLHGVIREVSLVLAGANPEARIDSVFLTHGDEDLEDQEEVIIQNGLPVELVHSDTKDEEDEKEKPEKTEEPEEKKESDKGDEKVMAENKQINANPEDEETVEDVFNTLTDKQKKVVYAIIGEALEKAGVSDDEEDDEDMKHNVFEADSYTGAPYISHDDMNMIMADAKRLGSLREAVEQHMEEGGVLAHAVLDANDNEITYGMANVDYLFPDARLLNNTPEFINKNDDWVDIVLNGTKHTPFSRVKSVYADITGEEARAKGYVKGNQKLNEVFTLLKRETSPQTIYKLQKMDRDDIIDITDFDVVAWLKGEMRLKLNEEIARAILIGDGRETAANDHIKHDCVHPIAEDASLYTIVAEVTVGESNEDTAKDMIKAAIRARKDYKGSGNPILFTSEDWLTEMMLLEDGLGHPLYADEAALARRMRVSRIVTVPVMENYTIDSKPVYGIIVNLSDYNVGADKGGAVSLFDDFDIDMNQQKYLIETRISGALVKPYSAIVLKAKTAPSTAEETVNDGVG